MYRFHDIIIWVTRSSKKLLFNEANTAELLAGSLLLRGSTSVNISKNQFFFSHNSTPKGVRNIFLKIFLWICSCEPSFIVFWTFERVFLKPCPRKQSFCVMRGMTHARVRINSHRWTQEVTQLRVTLPRIWIARVLPECAIHKNIYIYFNINFIRENDGKINTSNNFFIPQKILKGDNNRETHIGWTSIEFNIISITNIFWMK